MEGCICNPLPPGRTVFCCGLCGDLCACKAQHASCTPGGGLPPKGPW